MCCILTQVEGLRLWRVCALYDVHLASLDALWPLLAGAFAAPSAASAGAAAKASCGLTPSGASEYSSSTSSGVEDDALAREALLTAAELVCHAARWAHLLNLRQLLCIILSSCCIQEYPRITCLSIWGVLHCDVHALC